MTCDQIQQELAAYLSGEFTPAQKSQFELHLTNCAKCSAEWQQATAAWQALESWDEQPLPTELALSIAEKAHAAVIRAADEPETGKVIQWWQQNSMPFMPLGLGLVAAILSAVILGARSSFALLHPFALITAGALWVVLYGLIFSLFSIGQRSGQASWKFLAQAVLVGGGLFLLLTYVSPMPNSITFCSKHYLTQPFIERLSVGGTYFLFGGLYAFIPMGIAAFFSAHRQGKSPILHGSLAGGMFVLLLAPSIFMQCAPFALGVLLGWFGGALVGSIVGGALGYWLRMKLA